MTVKSIAGGQRPAADLVLAGPLAFAHGVLPGELANPKAPLAESVELQARKILSNLDELLAPHGLSRRDVVAVTVWLREHARFAARFEKAWPEFFAAARMPTRQLVGVAGLPREALVSMDFVLARGA